MKWFHGAGVSICNLNVPEVTSPYNMIEPYGVFGANHWKRCVVAKALELCYIYAKGCLCCKNVTPVNKKLYRQWLCWKVVLLEVVTFVNIQTFLFCTPTGFFVLSFSATMHRLAHIGAMGHSSLILIVAYIWHSTMLAASGIKIVLNIKMSASMDNAIFLKRIVIIVYRVITNTTNKMMFYWMEKKMSSTFSETHLRKSLATSCKFLWHIFCSPLLEYTRCRIWCHILKV